MYKTSISSILIVSEEQKCVKSAIELMLVEYSADLIELQDRGGLKWSSVSVLEAARTLRNLYIKLKKDSNLFVQFLKPPSAEFCHSGES